MESVYRVRSGEITQVERRFGDLRFTVNIQARQRIPEDGRSLPVHYCIVYWSRANNRVVRTDLYRDGYHEVEGIYLPLSRRITIGDDSGTTNRDLHFRDHEIFETMKSSRAQTRKRAKSTL
ncbi:MAG: DUF3386 family protein [Rubrobacter sp.]